MALQQARLNGFRLNASRLNYLVIPSRPDSRVLLWIDGAWVDVSDVALVAGATVTQALNEVPDTATIRFRSTVVGQPLKGKPVAITQNHPYAPGNVFAGHVLAVRSLTEGKPSNLIFECDCIDYTWTLDFRKVTKRYTNQLASAIITDLAALAAAAVQCHGIFPLIDEITFTNESIAQAISRVCERGGNYWYQDSDRVVQAFDSASVLSAGTITQADSRQSRTLVQHEDLSPVATVIHGRGGGAAAGADAIAGQTSLPVVDPAWYDAVNGGTVECGPQRFTYASVQGVSGGGSLIGQIALPPSGATYYAPGGNGTGSFQPGNRWIGVTNVTTDGETTVGPLTLVTFGANSNLMVGVFNAQHPPDLTPKDPKVKAFRVYVGSSGGGPETLGMLTYSDMTGNPANQYGFRWDNPDGYFLQTGPSRIQTTVKPPTASSAGSSSLTVSPGATSIPEVEDLTPFPAAGGWLITPGGQIVRFTGKSATSGAGSLTGVPASGVGSITAPIRSGTLKLAPYLDGIPASGANAIKYPIKTGDEVYVFVERSDAVAIANLQAWLGFGDGKRYEFLTDGRLSLKELTTRADAMLAYRKDPLVTVTFESRDPLIVVGRTISFNTTQPPIAGTFLIQRVQLSDFPVKAQLHPLPARRRVEASSRRFTFEDLVQQIKLLGRIN